MAAVELGELGLFSKSAADLIDLIDQRTSDGQRRREGRTVINHNRVASAHRDKGRGGQQGCDGVEWHTGGGGGGGAGAGPCAGGRGAGPETGAAGRPLAGWWTTVLITVGGAC